MSVFAIHPEALRDSVAGVLGEQARCLVAKTGEVTVEVVPANYLAVMRQLRDAPGCQFEQLIDLCGVDYSAYQDVGRDGPRFVVVVHLLLVLQEQRLFLEVVEMV